MAKFSTLNIMKHGMNKRGRRASSRRAQHSDSRSDKNEHDSSSNNIASIIGDFEKQFDKIRKTPTKLELEAPTKSATLVEGSNSKQAASKPAQAKGNNYMLDSSLADEQNKVTLRE